VAEPRDIDRGGTGAGRRAGGPEDELVEAARHRVSLPLERSERRAALIAAPLLAAGAAALLLAAPPEGTDALLAAALVAAYAVASRIRFDVGAAYAAPTQLALVPLLVLLPASLVPALALAGILLGQLPDYLTRRRHPQRALLAIAAALPALAAALVVAAGDPEPALADWPLYAAAVAAQLAVAAAVRGRGRATVTRWSFAVDVLLTPPALAAATALSGADLVLVVLLPLLALLGVLARERRTRLEQALELRNAYLGTTILLADLIEGEDEGGAHSQGVVALSVEVADELGLDRWHRRRTEYAARLHDVGKIAVPKEIVSKPGPLDPAEWKLMREHTMQGERMLAQVGGALREVGAIVRGSHERWDGAGYPDGLAGEEIPVEARIVACCEAFASMTTDRSYRRALSTDAALNEIRRGSSTQFDPSVASALVRVVLRREAEHAALRPDLRRTRRTRTVSAR
jgi:hypothetical protein